MADTLLRHLSTAEQYLLFATKFWSLISTISCAGALSSFYSTQQYADRFSDHGKYIFSSIIAAHLIIFFSNPKTLKTTFAAFYHGTAMKWALRFTAMRFGYMLHLVPEQSVIGLIFVICVWIDANAIARIIRPSNDLWILNSVFMVIVSRGSDLYGFSGRYWLVMLLCLPLIYVQIRLEGYKSDETEKKEE